MSILIKIKFLKLTKNKKILITVLVQKFKKLFVSYKKEGWNSVFWNFLFLLFNGSHCLHSVMARKVLTMSDSTVNKEWGTNPASEPAEHIKIENMGRNLLEIYCFLEKRVLSLTFS